MYAEVSGCNTKPATMRNSLGAAGSAATRGLGAANRIVEVVACVQHQTTTLLSHILHALAPETRVLFCGHSVGALV